MYEIARDWAALNASIERHLPSCPFWTQVRNALIVELGESGASFVEEMIKFASAQEDLWMSREFIEAANEVVNRLAERYPELSRRGCELISNWAAWEWR